MPNLFNNKPPAAAKDMPRVISTLKSALPHRASLDLQKRPRSGDGARRTSEFLRIARHQRFTQDQI